MYGFEMRKKGKFKKAEEFATRIKKVHEKAEAALKKSQEEIRKYADRKRSEAEEYRIGDWLLLSTKDLKYQMKGRLLENHSEAITLKLMESPGEGVQKGIAYWDKQNHAVPAPNCVLKVRGEIIKVEGL